MNIPSLPARTAYTIQNNGNYFTTGYTASGEQVLMGLVAGDCGPEVLCVLFDVNGKFLTTTSDPIPAGSARTADTAASRQVVSVQQRMGFQPGTIRVQRFAMPGRAVGIDDLPDHYQEFLASPGHHDPKRQEELAEDVRQWIEEGDFVLRWGEDFYLDSEGDVSSS